MSVSFDGLGQVCATFWGGGLSEGHVVKVTGNGTVGACSEGDAFCGTALCCKEDACTVQVGGFVTVRYSGTEPSLGRTALEADGLGGVRSAAKTAAQAETAGGASGTAAGAGSAAHYLVVDVDSAAKTATILL